MQKTTKKKIRWELSALPWLQPLQLLEEEIGCGFGLYLCDSRRLHADLGTGDGMERLCFPQAGLQLPLQSSWQCLCQTAFFMNLHSLPILISLQAQLCIHISEALFSYSCLESYRPKQGALDPPAGSEQQTTSPSDEAGILGSSALDFVCRWVLTDPIGLPWLLPSLNSTSSFQKLPGHQGFQNSTYAFRSSLSRLQWGKHQWNTGKNLVLNYLNPEAHKPVWKLIVSTFWQCSFLSWTLFDKVQVGQTLPTLPNASVAELSGWHYMLLFCTCIGFQLQKTPTIFLL